jgi:hypothetical protein
MISQSVMNFPPDLRGGPVEGGEILHLVEVLQRPLVVAHQQERGAVLATDLANQHEGLMAVPRVEVAGRFIGQHEPRPVGQGPGHGHALLLPRGELPRKMLQPVAQAHPRQDLAGMRGIRPARTEAHAEQDVFQHRVPLQEIEGLENVAELVRPQPVALRFPEGGHLHAIDPHAAAVGRQNPRDQVQEGGLARPAFTAQGPLGAGLERELPHVHHPVRPAPGPGVGLGEAGDFQQRHGRANEAQTSRRVNGGAPARPPPPIPEK